MMNTKEKYTLAELVIEHALKGGAQQISVIIDETLSNNIDIRDRKIDRLAESNRNSLTINLFIDRKYSSHSTNRLRKEDLFNFTDEAIAATKYLAEDEFRMLPEPDLYYKGGGTDPGVHDTTLESIDVKTKIMLANAVVDEAFGKDERIISVSSYYSDSISRRILVTSNGFKGDNARSDISLYATVSMKSDPGRPSDYWYEAAQSFEKLIKTDIGKKALERTIRKIGPRKVTSGKYPMVVENRVVQNLMGPFYNALQGSNIYLKQSFLEGKKGKAVGSKLMSLTDDPTIPSFPGSRLFDQEGLASVRRSILEEGVLQNFYIDTYYGRKLKMEPTSGENSNVLFTPLGTKNCEELVGTMKKGIFVTEFNGGNCNGSTGDFSYGIEGFYIENGKIVHPVNEMNITGNMNELWFRLADAGNDVIKSSSFRIPSLLFESIDFSGI
jgi:PmbA protein